MAKRKGGRPSRYETEIKPMFPAIRGWYMKGISKEQIAKDLLGITPSTLYEYQKKYKEFSECFKKSKEVADFEVVNALHENATGYWRTEQVVSQKRTVSYNSEGKRVETTEPVIVEIQRWYPANVTAQIYWTKNRMSKDWSDKKESNVNVGDGNITFNILPASQRPPEEESEDVDND